MPVYQADAFFDQHVSCAKARSVLARIGRSSPQQIFMRSVDAMLADFIALGHEEFPVILAYLAQAPWRRGAIVEGCALLPELVAQISKTSENALYLIPTETFQRRHYAERAWINEILAQTSDPETAWENWRKRDAQYSGFVKKQAKAFGFRVLEIDSSLTQDDVYELAHSQLGNRFQSQ